jgi:hypothetical protein
VNAAARTTHIAWVTSPTNETPRRVEVSARDRLDALQKALRGQPAGSRATCRAADHSSYILSNLAVIASSFPLISGAA